MWRYILAQEQIYYKSQLLSAFYFMLVSSVQVALISILLQCAIKSNLTVNSFDHNSKGIKIRNQKFDQKFVFLHLKYDTLKSVGY